MAHYALLCVTYSCNLCHYVTFVGCYLRYYYWSCACKQTFLLYYKLYMLLSFSLMLLLLMCMSRMCGSHPLEWCTIPFSCVLGWGRGYYKMLVLFVATRAAGIALALLRPCADVSVANWLCKLDALRCVSGDALDFVCKDRKAEAAVLALCDKVLFAVVGRKWLYKWTLSYRLLLFVRDKDDWRFIFRNAGWSDCYCLLSSCILYCYDNDNVSDCCGHYRADVCILCVLTPE